MKKLLAFLLLALSITIVSACSGDHEGHEDKKGNNEPQIASKEGLLHLNTKNVTRLNSDNPLEVAVLTSQTIWPATHAANQPGTIMLAPLDQWQLALASLNLVHHPNDGPLLFTNEGMISDLILNEINRLNPKGNVNGTQIMVLGSLNEGELDKLTDFEVVIIEENDPAALAYQIDEFYSELIDEVPESVIIVSLEDKAKVYSIIAGSWITHMNESILYVSEKDIPIETIAALEKRGGNAAIYVVGPEAVISNDVANQLSQFGQVTRIAGDTPEQVSIEFAKFRDPVTKFGWGITNPGHGLVMVPTSNPEFAIAAAPFAHLGKHAPMVWLEDGKFTETMHEYLAQLKPTFEHDPTEGPYNHAYLIASEQLVPFIIQGYIDEVLEIVPANGDGHGGHGAHGGHGH